MTKLDEAVEAAAKEYDDEYIYRAEGWDDCRAQILKKAGISVSPIAEIAGFTAR